MLTYNYENRDVPLYEYVYKCIKNDILCGNLKQGEKLPSKRTFAKNNGVSTITIQNAYEQLISEGYVYTIPKKGYYVADIENMVVKTNVESVKFDIRIPKQKESYRIDLSSNKTNPEYFPFSVWAKLCRETIASRSNELMEVTPTGGAYELRSAIAKHLKSFRGMSVDPNQIVIGAGTEYLYGLLIQLLGSDKNYCTENPGYKKLVQIYEKHNIKCYFANMDEKGISVESLRRANADVAHISPTHHFPTGISMPANRRYEALSWANESDGRYVIEDDYDSEFRPSGKPIPPMFSIDRAEKVVYMNTFSKSLTPTIRISYMILPPHLINRFYKELSFYSCTVSNFEQYTLSEFINQGFFEKHINRMRLYYSKQRKRLITNIENSKLNEVCEIIENDSGLHFLLRLKTDKPDNEITDMLKEKGIQIRALSEYYLAPARKQEHLFIMNYSDIDMEKIEEAIEEITGIL